MEELKEKSEKEIRVRKITQLYYSRPEIQKIIFEFSRNREICPRYFEGFGKRPDSFQFQGDLFELVKKGATSFHCSEEIWTNPLDISTELKEKQINELRIGWDFLLDIDSKYIDFSKIMLKEIIKLLNFHGIKNIGIKFSGSKGFHMIIPWKAFPKEINGIKTSEKFPEYPRTILKYINEKINKSLVQEITKLTTPSKYVRDFQASEEVIPDLILVSPRHLFRMPYSLHEKTALSSVVLTSEKIEKFELKDADPMNLSSENLKNFIPDSKENEAKELLVQALDWAKDKNPEEEKKNFKKEFQQIKIENFSDSYLPPSIQKILQGVQDGKKRSLFILLNLFRAIGMDKNEIEKRIYSWNEKNGVQLKKGYIQAQISWAYKNKIVLPPNFDKDYYKGIGILPTLEELRFKNPVNYVVRKTTSERKSFDDKTDKKPTIRKKKGVNE